MIPLARDQIRSSRRFFIAIRATSPVASMLSAMQVDLPRCRWVRPTDLHLTLRFLGALNEDQQSLVETALRRVRVKPFFLPLEGVGRFPPRGNPGVVWVGVGNGHPHLHQLRQQVDDLLLAAGIPVELRPFVPHVTVGRTQESPPAAVDGWIKRHREFAGPTWPVDSFDLMATTVAAINDSVYSTVQSHPLGK